MNKRFSWLVTLLFVAMSHIRRRSAGGKSSGDRNSIAWLSGAKREYNGACLTHPRPKRETLGITYEVVQKKSRVAVLWDADAPRPKIAFDEYVTVAPAMNLQLQSLEVRGPTPNFDPAFQAAAKGRAQALITIINPLLARYME
jgi:hypothetical protein